jgi:mono/diheme cytochrome c family protein
MRKMNFAAIFGTALLGLASLAIAEPAAYDLPEETAVLEPGPGLETAQSNCVACHSADYNTELRPFTWTADPDKIIAPVRRGTKR